MDSMSYSKALLLCLAASSLSVVGLLAAAASQPEITLPDPGWLMLPTEKGKSSRATVAPSDQVVEFDKGDAKKEVRVEWKGTQESKLLPVAAPAPAGPRSALGFVETI